MSEKKIKFVFNSKNWIDILCPKCGRPLAITMESYKKNYLKCWNCMEIFEISLKHVEWRNAMKYKEKKE